MNFAPFRVPDKSGDSDWGEPEESESDSHRHNSEYNFLWI